MNNHIILCGLGKVGTRVLTHLQDAGLPVTVIDQHCAADDARLRGGPLVQGDCRQADLWRRAGLDQARGVVILISDDLVGLSATLLVRHLHPTVPIVVRLFNQNLIARLGSAVPGVQALSTSALAAPLLALLARTGKALGVIPLEVGPSMQVAKLDVSPISDLVGKKVGDLAREHQVRVVAHLGDVKRFLRQVDPEATLQAGQRLVVCGEQEKLARLFESTGASTHQDLFWAGKTQRLGRVAWRALAGMDLPLKVCLGLLLAIILNSVVVFRLGEADTTVVDSFYRTVSLIATGADLHGERLGEGAWLKVYIGVLRLVGVALIAAFTAIFTNYLVRSNLGGALEIRRIPERGHMIVCGLGNVGFRVVEELLEQGEQVVVIQRARDNPFISTTRRLGVAVIVGDATMPEVLRQAHASGARAVIAATSDDLANLEIALLARELAPQGRVVVRLTDSALARTLREAAGIRQAVSIPDLAAPAFVFALFGDRVRTMFMVEGRFLAVLDLVVQAAEVTLVGQSLSTLAATYGLAPLHLTGADGQAKPMNEDTRLAIDDCLTTLLTLEDLQKLSGRERKVGTT